MRTASARCLSPFAAWALAFGCAVGWDSFLLPWTTFLPKAGPVGTVLGILVGGLVAAVIAWNYHFMINRQPGPGGVYSYATEAFGCDHGFICAWFFCLTYIAIVWADATVLVTIVRYLLGDVFHFGFHYAVAGFEVCFGDILISLVAISVAAAICCRRRLSGGVQTVLAIAFAVGILACFGAAVFKHANGISAMSPAFVPRDADSFSQVMRIIAFTPWLFIGFESVSNLSGEFSFPLKRSFGVMAAALVAAIIAYVLLTLIPVLASGGNGFRWVEFIRGSAEMAAFDTAKAPLGKAGLAILGATLFASVFTNLIGNTVAASRLLLAMAEDGVLPPWFGKKNADGAPQNAILAIAAVSLFIFTLGRTVVDIIVDIAIVGIGIAYAYTSAATFVTARKTGDRLARATGLCGLVFAIMISLLFILPNLSLDSHMMVTESYFVIILWCIAGLITFLSVFRHDHFRRFGHSTVVWISLLASILFMSVMWIRQTTYDTTANVFNGLVRYHSEVCLPAASKSPTVTSTEVSDAWRDKLRDGQTFVNRSILRNNYVQFGLTILSFALMFRLYSILRRRERDLENEKAKAKSYFFSTVSHDIRTPLNAIIGFSEMLKAGLKTEAEREQALDAIVVSGKTLLGLINDVLDLSKLESGKMEILPEPTDCPHLMRELMDALRVSSGKPGLELRCHVEDMPQLMLDPQRLRQIVFNLVGNAVKFTEKGYVELRAAFDRPIESKTGVFRLEVEDTGCGINEKDKQRIGSAYVQVGSKDARNGGTGLGLAICAQLAIAMGGKLSFVSALGRGSTFSIVIPGVKVVPAAERRLPRPENVIDAPARIASRQLPRHVLLVDDSKMNLMVLKAHLKNIGDFDVVLANDGQEALDVLETPTDKPFDLVLTDMWMPNLDGEGLVKAIRARPTLASLRVVVVTADVELQGKAADMGFDDTLFKPVTAEKLIKVLRGDV